MSSDGPAVILFVVGWILYVICPIATAVVAVAAWRRPAHVLTVLVIALTAVTLIVTAILPEAAPPVVTTITAIAALLIATAGGSPVVRLLFDRTTFEEQGAHGGILVGEREVLRGGEVIGMLERFAVVGAVMAGYPEALAVIIAIKGVGRFTELENGAVRERFIVGTLGSWIWAAAAAGMVLLLRS
jgi:hypothetical protein